MIFRGKKKIGQKPTGPGVCLALFFLEIRADQKKTFSHFETEVSETLGYSKDICSIKLSSGTKSSSGEEATSSNLALIAHCFN